VAQTDAALSIRNVSKSFGEIDVLSNTSLGIGSGAIATSTGGNGYHAARQLRHRA
jgi:multiple sugar transport system ATP-binding protein